jgi:hypothetical protein
LRRNNPNYNGGITKRHDNRWTKQEKKKSEILYTVGDRFYWGPMETVPSIMIRDGGEDKQTQCPFQNRARTMAGPRSPGRPRA